MFILIEEKNKDGAENAYKEASEEATKLASTHPIRLGLALNHSVFHYEIRNDSAKACELAKSVRISV